MRKRGSNKSRGVLVLALALLGGCSMAGQAVTGHHDSRPAVQHHLKAYTVTNPGGTRSDVCSTGTGDDLSRVMGDADEPKRHPAGDVRCNSR